MLYHLFPIFVPCKTMLRLNIYTILRYCYYTSRSNPVLIFIVIIATILNKVRYIDKDVSDIERVSIHDRKGIIKGGWA